jgi:hypothetical protein
MTINAIESIYPVVYDTSGQALENGYVYIGSVNNNPETNPINVYWDAALTIPAAQPLRTINGYYSRKGSPAQPYVDSDFSITVRDKNGALVYSSFTYPARMSSEYVTYKAGLVNTTVKQILDSKRIEYANVKDPQFGAVGDGVTDDTAAIQAAVNAAKRVYFPPGIYLISSPIDLPNGIWLEGAGGFQNTDTDRISRINYTGTSGWAFQYVSPATPSVFAGDFYVNGLMIFTPSISSLNSGGGLLFGNTDLGNFNNYAFIGRVNIEKFGS